MPIRFEALTTAEATVPRAGGADAYGNPPEHFGVPSRVDMPCRHCLDDVPAGQGVLVRAWRPFVRAHPYAETGPGCLCAGDCPSGAGPDLPSALRASPDCLVKV